FLAGRTLARNLAGGNGNPGADDQATRLTQPVFIPAAKVYRYISERLLHLDNARRLRPRIQRAHRSLLGKQIPQAALPADARANTQVERVAHTDSLSNLQRCQTDQHQNHGDDPEPDNDLRLRPAFQFKVDRKSVV